MLMWPILRESYRQAYIGWESAKMLEIEVF